MLPSPTTAALGPDLYAGTSGVALFLAHLHEGTGDDLLRRTALGAIRHALERAAGIRPGRALALYTGRLGVALAAARCGRLLGSPGLLEEAARLGDALCDDGATEGDDLTSGLAGAVTGLLALGGELGDPAVTARATALATPLAARAGALALTGMAHGEAGLVHALLEVAEATGDASVVPAAARAIAHESDLFDEATGNWADLRPDGSEIDDVVAASAMAWCHGAPGIVLSRRRAPSLLGQADGRQVAAGARTTARWIRAALATRPGDLSLCHGLTGNAEALADGTGDAAARDLALEVASLGAEEFGRPGLPWPCGIPAGETPGLMLGLAGIGLFYLRLADPSIPSVLAPGAGLSPVAEPVPPPP